MCQDERQACDGSCPAAHSRQAARGQPAVACVAVRSQLDGTMPTPGIRLLNAIKIARQ